MVQTVSVPGVGDLDFPDGMSQQEMSAAIQKNFPQIHTGTPASQQYQDPNSDIPQVDASGNPMPLAPTQQQPEPSLTQKLGSGAKALGVMAGNAIPATIGALSGAIYGGSQEIAGMIPRGEGEKYIAQEAQRLSPFSTNDPLANEYMQNASNVLGSLDPGFIGRIGKGATLSSAAARDAEQAIRPAIQDATQAVKSIPDIGKTPLEISQGKTDFIKSQLEAGKTTSDLATKTIESGKVVDLPEAKAAIDQGFEEGLVSAVNATSPKNKSQLLKMVRISEQGKKDSRYASENRPSDVIGDSLAERIKFIKSTNKQAGNEIEAAANNIKGIPVNYQAPLDKFKSDIEAAGISIDENGSLNFKGSDLEFSPGDKRLISNIYSRAKTIDGSDAYRVHKLKRLIDRTVDYGKGSQTGITSGGESIVKGFRGAVDESLDNTFPEYNVANTKYSDTIGELNNFQKAVGNSIDLFGENSDKALGTKSRTLLSNAQNRVKLIDAIKSVDDVSTKYGANFDDDIMTQAMFANALDKHFGAAAKTSLLGDLETAGGSALERSLRGDTTLTGLGIETAKAVKNKLQGKNEENSYKALKALLTRKQKQ